MFDVAIVGAGPAGASCAAFCAQAGLHTLLLEREKFPREKVCGDCLNPSCWPILRRLGAAGSIRGLPHGNLRSVEFIGIDRQSVSIPLPDSGDREIAVKRSLFDNILMSRARELGAQVEEKATVTDLTAPVSDSRSWTVRTRQKTFEARVLVAADGRNSTVARLCNLLPRPPKERVALQTHVPLPRNFGERVVLQFLRKGYSGQAPVGNGELNLCLVGEPASISSLKTWAQNEFAIPENHPWKTITPLTRSPLPPARLGLFLIGDAARVVEPFTGEGIFYALRSGDLAAEAIARLISGSNEEKVEREYAAAHHAMYSSRLWLNQLARAAVLSPRFASFLLRAARHEPAILRLLTTKVVRLIDR
jgi:geranylgeranyl reductase family protein